MTEHRFDALAKRLANVADRRGALRLLAGGTMAALGVAAVPGDVAADRAWVDRCVRNCPDTCRGFSGEDYSQCGEGCKTCCWQGLFGAERSARCMSAMLDCIEAPNCPAVTTDSASTVAAPGETATNTGTNNPTTSAPTTNAPTDVNTGGNSGTVTTPVPTPAASP